MNKIQGVLYGLGGTCTTSEPVTLQGPCTCLSVVEKIALVSINLLFRHMRVHRGPIICDLCGSAFLDRDLLVQHMRYRHTADEEKQHQGGNSID